MTTDAGARRGREPKVFHHSAGAVVIVDGRCLAIRLVARPEWVLPKGHLEEGETAEAAAVREVREETGLEVRTIVRIGETRYSFGPDVRHRKLVEWFLAEQVGGSLQLDPAFGEATLLDEAEVSNVLTHEADRDLVARAFALARERR